MRQPTETYRHPHPDPQRLAVVTPESGEDADDHRGGGQHLADQERERTELRPIEQLGGDCQTAQDVAGIFKNALNETQDTIASALSSAGFTASAIGDALTTLFGDLLCDVAGFLGLPC